MIPYLTCPSAGSPSASALLSLVAHSSLVFLQISYHILLRQGAQRCRDLRTATPPASLVSQHGSPNQLRHQLPMHQSPRTLRQIPLHRTPKVDRRRANVVRKARMYLTTTVRCGSHQYNYGVIQLYLIHAYLGLDTPVIGNSESVQCKRLKSTDKSVEVRMPKRQKS